MDEWVRGLVAAWRLEANEYKNLPNDTLNMADLLNGCADELEAAFEQAEREAVGRGGAECKCSRGLDGTLDASGCLRHKFIVQPDGHAAPRPEASTWKRAIVKHLDRLSDICRSLRNEVGKSPQDESVEDALFGILQALRLLVGSAALAAQPGPVRIHTSRVCSEGDHGHCGGQVKFANADNTDDCFPCACKCHGAAQPEQEKQK